MAVHSEKARVNISNGGSEVGRCGCVLITPLESVAASKIPSKSHVQPSVPPIVTKLLLKAVSDSTKKEGKTFTLPSTFKNL